MILPSDVVDIIDRLKQNGIEGYAVGGCVRDFLLGNAPKDYDIAAGASPERLVEIFADHRTINTGLKHGTLTVIKNHTPYEITAFRIDGNYTDSRHPDRVTFCSDITSDLSRRDFTINAMAYSPDKGLIDPFGGREDLEKGILRAVGDPILRFREDALRIMRLLRFAARYGFTVERATADAATELCSRLQLIAKERIFAELRELLLCDFVGDTLYNFSKVIFTVIPELSDTYEFPQNTPYHKYDVWRHICHSVNSAEKILPVRLTMLLHDIAKPECATVEDGISHFKGHAAKGAKCADGILSRLRCDNALREQVVRLTEHHDDRIKTDRISVKRQLKRLGGEDFFLLMKCQAADAAAKSDYHRKKQSEDVAKLTSIAQDIISKGECFNLRALAVNGNDIKALGITDGKKIGQILDRLLDSVIEKKAENKKAPLIKLAKDIQEM